MSPSSDWDRLSEQDAPLPVEDGRNGPGSISSSQVVTAVLADLVLILGLTTMLVLSLSLQSLPFDVRVLGWAVPVALAWWLMAAVICLRILKASPGMIIAGLSFSTELRGVRLFLTLLTLVFGAACLGLPLFPGDAGSSLLARAAASPLVRRSFA